MARNERCTIRDVKCWSFILFYGRYPLVLRVLWSLEMYEMIVQDSCSVYYSTQEHGNDREKALRSYLSVTWHATIFCGCPIAANMKVVYLFSLQLYYM